MISVLVDLIKKSLNVYNETGQREWRIIHQEKRNLYPIHTIVPVAHWIDIYKGERFS